MEQLMAMGFSADAAQTALQRCGGDVQRAVEDLMGEAAPAVAQQLPAPPIAPPADVDEPSAASGAADESGVGERLGRFFSGLLAPSSPVEAYLLTGSHGGRAVCARGQQFDAPSSAEIPGGGSGRGVTLGAADGGLCFVLDGDPSSYMAVRLRDDARLALEVNWRKFEVDNEVSLWGSNEPANRQWACRFCLLPDGTLSPVALRGPLGRVEIGPPVPKGLALGIGAEGTNLILVRQDDTARRLLFRPVAEMTAQVGVLEQQQMAAASALREQAAAICSAEMKASMRRDGFVHAPGAIPLSLVRKARQEMYAAHTQYCAASVTATHLHSICSLHSANHACTRVCVVFNSNRAIGASSGGADAFKAKTFANHPSITSLFNSSVLPLLCQELLGQSPGGGYRQERGQLALRFPGDMCSPPGSCECDAHAFESIRRHWHIDGLPSDFIPGVTDHFGRIHNFDMLVGVLLSDVEDSMGGELCVYPGSHSVLARHFSAVGLERLQSQGNAALPTGEETDALFGGSNSGGGGAADPPRVHHCVGKAGDVFLA